MRLHEYATELRGTMLALEQMAEDVPEDAIKDTLEGVQAPFEEKAVAVAAFIQNCEAEAKAIQDAIDRMQARQSVLTSKIDGTKKYLADCMVAVSMDTIKRPEFVIKTYETPGAVVVEDESKIPAGYWAVVPETKRVDKTLISKALKDNKPVPGCSLKVETRVKIK